MGRGSKYSRNNTQATIRRRELMQAKMALVAAREQNEAEAFTSIVGAYPSYLPELTEFNAALIATSSYDLEIPTPQTESIAVRALSRAMLTVFPVQTTLPASYAIRGAVATLRELRKSRGISLAALAERLGLGVDVVSSLEAGMVKVASIPDRLIRALGDALSTSLDQITEVLDKQIATEAALKRMRTEGSGKGDREQLERDFGELVRASPNMSPDQKALWLDDGKMA
jgi:transcriptional regulator with XRE-family HTH domain